MISNNKIKEMYKIWERMSRKQIQLYNNCLKMQILKKCNQCLKLVGVEGDQLKANRKVK